MMSINLVQIQCFCAVARYGNFSLAADSLYMSVSSVSKNVSELENLCGFPLLIRHGRHSELTEKGHQILRDCNRVLKEYNQLLSLRDNLQNETSNEKPPIYFYGNPIMTDYGIIKLLNKYNVQWPGIKIQISEAEDEYARNALLHQECDLAFMTDIALDMQLFDYQKYISETLSVIVSWESDYAKKDAIHIKDLKDKKLIGIQRESIFFNFYLESCRQHGFIPKFVLLTSKPDMALAYMEDHKDTIFLLPHTPAQKFDPRKYKMIEITDSPEFNYVFAWNKNRTLSKDIKSCLEYLHNVDVQEIMSSTETHWKWTTPTNE